MLPWCLNVFSRILWKLLQTAIMSDGNICNFCHHNWQQLARIKSLLLSTTFWTQGLIVSKITEHFEWLRKQPSLKQRDGEKEKDEEKGIEETFPSLLWPRSYILRSGTGDRSSSILSLRWDQHPLWALVNFVLNLFIQTDIWRNQSEISQ